MQKVYDYSLYLVADRAVARGRDLLEIIRAAVNGGTTVVQIRDKEGPVRDFVELVRQALKYLYPRGIPLFVNDRLDIALAAGAQGLHVGQEDMHIHDIREICGSNLALGLSVNNTDQCLEAEQLSVDYIGVGPVFSTQTKLDAKQQLGLEGLRKIRRCSKLPLVAIGGIDISNAYNVVQAGADGIAVVSAICCAESPEQSTYQLWQTIQSARAEKNM